MKPITKEQAESWLGDHRDIWNHPYISDRTDAKAYELAELLADFANHAIGEVKVKSRKRVTWLGVERHVRLKDLLLSKKYTWR